MSIKRPIFRFTEHEFFVPGLPIYVNRAVESFETGEHSHDFVEIAYVSEGSGTHYTGERSTPVTAGDIFLLPVGVSHVFRPSTPAGTRPLIVYNCLLSYPDAETLFAAAPGGQELSGLFRSADLRGFRDSGGEVDALFRELHAEYTASRPGRETALFAGVLRLLLVLHRRDCGSEAKPAQPAASAGTGIDAALAALRRQPAQPPSAAELARLAGLGARQFHRLFVRRTGMTPNDYAQSVRIREACRLLASTDRKVGDIAAAVGYRNLPFFNGLFKRKTGLSPREYRRREADEQR